VDAPQIVPAKQTHVGPLVAGMSDLAVTGIGRASARREVRTLMARCSEVWVAELDGRALAMWGLIAETMQPDGYVWFCVTEAARSHKRMMVNASRAWLRNLLEDGMLLSLHGYVLDGDVRSARYAEFLGFTVCDPSELAGVMVRKIRMTR
jgi:hypothetical protein